jgi:integrase
MGCIYRMKNSPYWWLKYQGVDGRPQYESSRTTDHSAAKDMLREREGRLAQGVPVTSAVGRLKFKDAARDLVNDFTVNRRKSLDEVERRLRLHLLPYFGRCRMVEIDTPMIRRYIAKRQTDRIVTQHARTITRRRAGRLVVEQVPELTKPVSPAEINRELQLLKRCFNLAVEEGRLLHTPHVPMLAEHNVRKGFLESDQLSDVLAFLPSELQPVVLFAYLTGWRVPSEVLPLEWARVDFAANEVRLDPGTTKNGDGRVFPMNADLRALLLAQRKLTDDLQRKRGAVIRFVFHRQGVPIRSLSKAWRSACTHAGVPGRLLHDLRRSAVRNMVRAGIAETVAMQLSGHKTRSVFDRYNITSKRDLHDAAVRLVGLVATVPRRRGTSAIVSPKGQTS